MRAESLIRNTVGLNGCNAHRDVRAVQAALREIRTPGGGATYWDRRINGCWDAALARAIGAFQIAIRQQPNGRIQPGDATETALRRRPRGELQMGYRCPLAVAWA